MVKQVIVIRQDLRMRRGKECSSSAHASQQFLLKNPLRTVAEEHWLNHKQKIICVAVNSEQELFTIHEQCKNANIMSHLFLDAGLTEFRDDDGNPVPTYTCLAIGPEYSDKIDIITGTMKLY